MKKRITWKTKLALLSVIFLVVGCIPWETWFPIEIKNPALQQIADYGLVLGALLLLIILAFIYLKQRINGKGALLLYVCFAALLIMISYIGLMLGFVTRIAEWDDYRVYKSDKEYLVLETLDGILTFEPGKNNLRLVRTASVTGIVRWQKAVYPLGPDDKIYSKEINELHFKGKTWHKIEITE